LPELTDVIIEKKASLFVCAIGVPPKEMVDKLHAAGIVVMKYVRNKIQTNRAVAFFSNIW
jgi:NAD(P)H-dependent flavin oxidoreductase YrpB (nitropropane dioxygenase family)